MASKPAAPLSFRLHGKAFERFPGGHPVEMGEAAFQPRVRDGLKDRLLRIVSHELRTPISVILGNVELLMNGAFGGVNEGQKNSLLSVRRSGAGLLFHIENALELAQLEAGEISVNADSFTVAHVRAEVMELLGEEVARKGIEMRWDIQASVPPLFTDREKIVRIFRNLVDNAIKFTDRGSVRVKISWDPAVPRVECDVEDTGVGIPPAQFQTIFDSFHQVDSSRTRAFGGLGLGLRNVKKALELLSGGIEVESAVGRGSRFRFWFPPVHGLPARPLSSGPAP